MCEYENYITANLSELTKRTIRTPHLLDKCLEQKILSEYEVQKLNLPINTEQDFASRFWKYIQTRADCLEKLTSIFRVENQNRIVAILEKGERDDGSDQKYNFIKNLKPLEVEVVRPNEKQAFEKDVKYKLDPDIIGGALLISATVFDNTSQNRSGAEKDSEYMEKLWTQLGYKVYSRKGNISRQNLLDVRIPNFLKQFKKNSNWQSCVVFIGTHGENGKLYMSDEEEVDLYDDLISKFVECDELKDKPKIFIFQACQNIAGNNVSQVNLSDTKDLILCFPTVPGDEARRDKLLGGWFIYTLTDVFMNKAYKLELREMLNEVRKTMLNKIQHKESFDQVPYWIDFNGLQSLYFNVAPEEA